MLFKNDATIKIETELVKCKLEDRGEPWSVKKEILAKNFEFKVLKHVSVAIAYAFSQEIFHVTF